MFLFKRSLFWTSAAILVFVFTRLFFISLPSYAVTYFDEAITGLMGMHLLRGEFPVFYWGCPYLGPLEALFAALFFLITGEASTFALRLSPLLAYLIYGGALLAQARLTMKKEVFYFCFLFLIFPPYYLLHFSLTAIGDYMNTVMLGSLMILLTSIMITDEKRLNLRNVFLLGLLSGFSFWTFIQTAPVILACHLILFLRMRFSYPGIPLLLSFLGFVLGSLPFWMWNWNNDFLTFTMKVTGADPGSFPGHARNYYEVLKLLLGNYSLQPQGYRTFTAGLAAFFLIAVPCLLFSGQGLFARLKKPDPLLLLIVAFTGNSLAYIVSSHGDLKLPRYLLPLYSSLPVLLPFALSFLLKGRYFFVFSTGLLLLMSLPENIRFTKSNLDPAYINRFTPRRAELNEFFDYLGQNNIRHLYGAYCFTQILTFESKKSVTAADYSGFRNMSYLREADNDPRTGLAAEDLLGAPDSDSLESTIKLLTRKYQKKKCGRFTVFHDFKINDASDAPLPSGSIQSISVCEQQERKNLLNDRIFETFWETQKPMTGKEWITLTFVKPVRVTRLLLIPGTDYLAFPRGLRMEGTDVRGHRIKLAEAKSICGSFKVFHGKPRLFGKGEIEIRLDKETELSSVTLFQTGEDRFFHWKIGEIIPFEQKQENSLLISSVPEIPEDRFLVTTPELYLKHYYKTFHDQQTIPLYPPMLTYLHWSRVWDYDTPKRYLNMDSDLLFILPPDHWEYFKNYLQSHEIAYSLKETHNLVTVQTQSCGIPKDRKYIPLLPRTKWAETFNQNPVFEAFFPEPVLLYGFKLAKPPCGFQWKDLMIEILDSGGEWKSVAFKTHEAYWTDEVILESCREGSEVHFEKPVPAQKVRFILHGLYKTPQDLEDFCKSEIIGDFKSGKDEYLVKKTEASGSVAIFEETLSLDDFSLNPSNPHPGGYLEVHARFSWLKKKRKNMASTFFLHALDSTGYKVFQLDRDLDFGRNPQDLKKPFERKYFIKIPESIKEKSLRVIIGLYDQRTGKRSKPSSSHPVDMRSVELGEIFIAPDVHRPEDQ